MDNHLHFFALASEYTWKVDPSCDLLVTGETDSAYISIVATDILEAEILAAGLTKAKLWEKMLDWYQHRELLQHALDEIAEAVDLYSPDAIDLEDASSWEDWIAFHINALKACQQDELDEANDKLETALEQLSDKEKDYDRLEDKYNDLVSDYEDLESSYDALTVQVDSLTDEVRELRFALGEALNHDGLDSI